MPTGKAEIGDNDFNNLLQVIGGSLQLLSPDLNLIEQVGESPQHQCSWRAAAATEVSLILRNGR